LKIVDNQKHKREKRVFSFFLAITRNAWNFSANFAKTLCLSGKNFSTTKLRHCQHVGFLAFTSKFVDNNIGIS
jgi:hypothetical protein